VSGATPLLSSATTSLPLRSRPRTSSRSGDCPNPAVDARDIVVQVGDIVSVPPQVSRNRLTDVVQDVRENDASPLLGHQLAVTGAHAACTAGDQRNLIGLPPAHALPLIVVRSRVLDRYHYSAPPLAGRSGLGGWQRGRDHLRPSVLADVLAGAGDDKVEQTQRRDDAERERDDPTIEEAGACGGRLDR